ncbi:DUF3039 domain-containing protein [Demequina sp. NBRC 110056]|uniref:DUF3039 domain-containing protein n=1 Tax=Demequina sp. NBRC 110056 TaxID=1570345 RepID=UPI0009FC08AE|nr:DUF3039 domain-containing protein [Demequina sp. NBRC 110056]
MSETLDPQPDTGAPQGGTATIERVEQRELVEPGDAERFAHYVRKEKIMESAMSGEPVIALCGKVWIPGRDPKRFPVCPACKEILDAAFGKDDGED